MVEKSNKISASATILRCALAGPVTCRALLLPISALPLWWILCDKYGPCKCTLEENNHPCQCGSHSWGAWGSSIPAAVLLNAFMKWFLHRISMGSFIFKPRFASSADVALMCFCSRQKDFERPQPTFQSTPPAFPPGQEGSTDNPCWG